MAKLLTSNFKQSAVSQSYANHGHFHPSITEVEDPPRESTNSDHSDCSINTMKNYYTGERVNLQISNVL